MLGSAILLSALALASNVVAVPREARSYRPYGYNISNPIAAAYNHQWLHDHVPGKYNGSCTHHNQRVRKDFEKMAPHERKAYTDAINCLRKLPSQLNQTKYPAATNRYADWATQHVEKTQSVHLDGFFLTWHRMFIWLFENELHDQCGYKGTQPYWNWPENIDDLSGSILFNGDKYSMSSNGYPKDLNSSIVLTPPSPGNPGLAIPHGTGGGCIMSGPFANWTRTINTIPIAILTSGAALPQGWANKNESCLTRDLNPIIAQANLNQTAIDNALAAEDMPTFDFLLNGSPIKQVLGIHSGAHFTMGDPASDIFVSVQDPIWFPLHAQLDRLYVMWQQKHPNVALQLSGTETAVNNPPSPNVTLTTWEPNWGYFHESSLMVGELMNTTAGPFCYRYE